MAVYQTDSDSEIRALNQPPYSNEAEQSVIGGLLLDNKAWDTIADVVGTDDFYRQEHKLIFRAITALMNEQRPVDVVTLQEKLESTDTLEKIGGFSYLVTIVQNTPSAANIRRYAEIVRERSIIRQLAEVGTEIARNAYNPQGRTAEQLLDDAENKVFQIAESTSKTKQGFWEMAQLVSQNLKTIEILYARENADEVTGVATGFVDLDRKTSGLQKGDLIIVAGRPSMGKTAFAVNIAENVGLYSKLPVAVFSMEMGAAQLAMRMISSVGRVDQHALKTGKLDDQQWDRMTEAVQLLSDTPIFIDETPALTALEVRARARRLARRFDGNLGLIVIDYLQLMSGSGRSDNRSLELGEISRSLKALAKELQVPVIALSQLSRTVEQRIDKRPMMSDLRESGAIEQDADLIMFMYREEYYAKNSGQPVVNTGKPPGIAECIIGKHRNGPTGKVFLTFLGAFTRFENSTYVPENSGDDY